MAAGIFGAVLATQGFAQYVVFAQHDGKYHLVTRARAQQPMVTIDGKQVATAAQDIGMQKVEEFLPVLVTVDDLDDLSRDTESIQNTGLMVSGWLESPQDLENVYLVLQLNLQNGGKRLKLHEIGRLAAHERTSFTVFTYATEVLAMNKYELHVFVGGREALNSTIPDDARNSTIDRMIQKRIAGVQDASVAPFITSMPKYPRKAKGKGQATVTVRVGTDGRVYDPVVKASSEKIFNDPAIAAAKTCRFLPRIEQGRPVESQQDLVFDFAPPGKGRKT